MELFFIIGSIEHIWVRPDLPSADGFLHLEKAGLITSTGLDAYYTTRPVERLAYAKPGEKVRKAN